MKQRREIAKLMRGLMKWLLKQMRRLTWLLREKQGYRNAEEVAGASVVLTTSKRQSIPNIRPKKTSDNIDETNHTDLCFFCFACSLSGILPKFHVISLSWGRQNLSTQACETVMPRYL